MYRSFFNSETKSATLTSVFKFKFLTSATSSELIRTFQINAREVIICSFGIFPKLRKTENYLIINHQL